MDEKELHIEFMKAAIAGLTSGMEIGQALAESELIARAAWHIANAAVAEASNGE